MKINYVILKWVEKKQLWYMINKAGRFIQEFFDCGNVHNFYHKLDKKQDNHYRVTIERIDPMQANDAAPKGRLNSHYSMFTVNDQGVKTIEATVIIRDQSPQGASAQLISTLDGLASPAKMQVEKLS